MSGHAYFCGLTTFRVKDSSHLKGKKAKRYQYAYVGSSQRYVDYCGKHYKLYEPAVGDRYINLNEPILTYKVNIPMVGSARIHQKDVPAFIEAMKKIMNELQTKTGVL